MAIVNSLRVAFRVNGELRRLIGLYQNSNGSLIIPMDPGQHISGPPDPESNEIEEWPEDDLLIDEVKYSVHPSKLSPENNVIHFRQMSSSGRKFDSYHFTKAIKAKDGFAPITDRIVGSLFQRKAIDPTEKFLELGGYDHNVFAPVYSLFVADRSVRMGLPDGDYKAVNILIGDYNIVLLLCFMNVLPKMTDVAANVPTRDPKNLTLERDKILYGYVSAGMKNGDCLNWFKIRRDILRDFLISSIEKMCPEVDPRWYARARLQYFKDCRTDTFEFAHFVERARARGLLWSGKTGSI